MSEIRTNMMNLRACLSFFKRGANFKVWFYFPLIIFNSQPWAFAKSLLPTYQLPIWRPSSSRQQIVSYFKWNAFGFTWRNTTFDTLNHSRIVRNVNHYSLNYPKPFLTSIEHQNNDNFYMQNKTNIIYRRSIAEHFQSEWPCKV